MNSLILKILFILLVIPTVSDAKGLPDSFVRAKSQPFFSHSKGKIISTSDSAICAKLQGHATRTDGQCFRFGEYNGKAYICDEASPMIESSRLGIKKLDSNK